MKNRGTESTIQLDDEICDVSDLFFDPFQQQKCEILSKENVGIQNKGVFCKVLTFTDEDLQDPPSIHENLNLNEANTNISSDQNLLQILQRKRRKQSSQTAQKEANLLEIFSFNNDLKSNFNKTPDFKCLLQTPLKVFNAKYDVEIRQLLNYRFSNQKYIQLKKSINPCDYKKNPSAFFIGNGLRFQKQNFGYQTLFFFNLACYVQPYNPKVWIQAIELSKKLGLWSNAFKLSKTAFLFNPCPEFSDEYFLCGDKAQICAHQLRGILSSVKSPEKWQKIIYQVAKCEIKNRKLWRGIWIIKKYIASYLYKGTFFPAIFMACKSLESVGYADEGQRMLKNMLQLGVTKPQIYQSYIQMRAKYNGGHIEKQDLLLLDDCIDKISNETKYRISLIIAEYFLRFKNLFMAEQYISKSYKNAIKFCKGSGIDKACRQIYQTILPFQYVHPTEQFIQKYPNDEHLIFLTNRRRFIQGQKLIMYKFTNWKYYLQYALEGNSDILIQVYEENNQGRILTEAIHVLRLSKQPIVMLEYWRRHINNSLKSGELWCQGGRIYANLGQKRNAIKCFKYAIHFTPQYGDSFLELMKIYIEDSNFYQVNQLRKSFQISQPFYGNVFCFLQSKFNNSAPLKLSIRQVWQRAVYQVKQVVYNKKYDNNPQLTLSISYNEAVKYHGGSLSAGVRQLLFSCYQQIQSTTIRF